MSDAANPAQTLMEQAYEQLQEGRFEDALELFSSSLSVAPRQAKALRGRGLAYMQLHRWSLAAADFEAARALNPDDLDSWVDFSICLSMEDQVYQALAALEAVLAAQPECLRAHVELGRLHLRLGTIQKGRDHLQRALACRPTLEQRRLIESTLREQARLDRKRLYRPDFEALHQQEHARMTSSWIVRLRAWFERRRS